MVYLILSVFGSIFVCAAFLGGFVLGIKLPCRQDKTATQTRTGEKAAVSAPLTEEQERERRRRQIELANFWNYNGDEQPKPEDLV